MRHFMLLAVCYDTLDFATLCYSHCDLLINYCSIAGTRDSTRSCFSGSSISSRQHFFTLRASDRLCLSLQKLPNSQRRCLMHNPFTPTFDVVKSHPAGRERFPQTSLSSLRTSEDCFLCLFRFSRCGVPKFVGAPFHCASVRACTQGRRGRAA